MCVMYLDQCLSRESSAVVKLHRKYHLTTKSTQKFTAMSSMKKLKEGKNCQDAPKV